VRRLQARIDARLARHGDLGSKLIKGVVGTTGIKLAHAGIGFVTAILLARLLGPSGYGAYSFVMALVAFLTIPSELGIPGLAVREIAVANARKNWGHMRGFTIRAHQGIAVLSVVLMSAGAIALTLAGDRLDPVRRDCMWLGLALVPLISLGSLRGAMLRGLRKVLLGQLPEQIIRPAVLLIAIVAIWAFGEHQLSAPEVVASQILATSIAFFWGLLAFFRHRPADISRARPEFRTREWIKSTLPFGLSAMLLLINGRTDVLVLGLFRADADVGVYRVAVQMALPVIFGLQAVNAIQAPHIAHLYSTGDMKRLQKMITRSSQAVLAVAVPAVLVVVLFGQFLIGTLFGEEFSSAYVPLVILALGQLVNAGTGSVASLLNMTGHERDTLRSIMIAVVVNIALNFSLTPIWGIVGAATATATTVIVWNLTMWRAVYRRIGINASPFLRQSQ
jgi:O-antigen/teichoic acid export membrane protein